MQIAYLTYLLIYPIVLIMLIQSNIVAANYLMTYTVGIFLKLTSFHHVMYDNRNLMKRLKQVKESKDPPLDFASHFEISHATYEIAK